MFSPQDLERYLTYILLSYYYEKMKKYKSYLKKTFIFTIGMDLLDRDF